VSFQNLNYVNFSQKELDDFFSAAKKGDSEAFKNLSVFVRQISHSYFLSKLRQGKISNQDDVDDLTNNVYLTFAEQYQKIENLEFWLRRVLFLNFINWYKKSKSRRLFDIDDFHHLHKEETNPGNAVDANTILSVLTNLSEDKQQIIKMRFWEGLKFSEIAQNMKKSEDAVKKMFYRTIEELRNKF
jgi:RNA polymerase sigma-70 factor, ECF subfamily